MILQTAFTVNWGRGVGPGEFRRNVMAVLDPRGDQAILGIQELDEADAPNEHGILADELDPRDHRIGWRTMEPLIVPFRLAVPKDVVTFGCRGLSGFTPTRFITEAVVRDPKHPNIPPVVYMNQHPPIDRPATASRRAAMRRVHERRIDYWYGRGASMIWTGDMNDNDYPRMHRNEKTAVHDGYDYIRYIVNPTGAQLHPVKTGTIDLTIDKHDAHWARFAVSAPKGK